MAKVTITNGGGRREPIRINDGGDDTGCATTATEQLLMGNTITNFDSGCSKIKTTRNTLWFMIFSGFIIDSMTRTITNIAIVDMVAPKLTLNSTISITRNNRFSFERFVLDKFGFEYNQNGFKWNEYEQGLVLGSFYWFHWVTQIPGGLLAKKYGTKRVFGLINLIGSIISLIEPICAFIDYRLLIMLRVIQGCVYGMSWPSMHCLIGHWVPPNERSKFISSYSGHAVGISIFTMLFGYIISISTWEWTYYLGGCVGIVWWLVWYFLVYDTPAEHPRINPMERKYIEYSLGETVQKEIKLRDVPWKSIIKSRPMWMVAICQWGAIWSFITTVQQGPTYFKRIHNFNIRSSGFIAGAPYLIKMLFSYCFSIFADYLLKTKRMSRTNVRKMGGAVITFGQGLFMLGLSFSGYNASIAIVFFTLAIMSHGSGPTGPLANEVDISPNYASILLGITASIASTTGYITPFIVGSLTLNNQTPERWQLVFGIAAAVTISCGILYVSFADSTLQSWNTPKRQRCSNIKNRSNDHEFISINSPN